MWIARTPKNLTDSLLQFVGTKDALGFDDPALTMAPPGLGRIEPWTVAGQPARRQPHTLTSPRHGLIVLAQPLTHLAADMPAGIVPDQDQRGPATSGGLRGTPGQALAGTG